jgi:hypothetical protein
LRLQKRAVLLKAFRADQGVNRVLQHGRGFERLIN